MIIRKQTAVYWKRSGVDGFGRSLFDSPVEMEVRWVDKADLFTDSNGQEARSSSVVYPSKRVFLGDYFWPGNLSDLSESEQIDPILKEGAKEVRGATRVPNYKCSFYINKAFL